MNDYTAPLRDMRFVLDELVGIADIAELPGYGEATPDLIGPVLEEAAKFAGQTLAPLNRVGDEEGAVFENGMVRTPQGFREAYTLFAEGGWNSVPFDPKHGGQGLPWLLATALQEMWASANLSFSLCPMLTQGAIELLQNHGSPAQRAAYLPPLIAGTWTGTMCLTEPQAGSDIGAIRTRGSREGERYRIVGQKIFITYGEHDLAENIIHMVLARLPDAPPGVRGISLFIVPKYLTLGNGAPGPRNDLRCAAIERKLGIHASPTCVMSFGDNGGAVGYLVGEENRGIEYMFTMMNNARLGVGLQGLAVAERSYQLARAYARIRVQSRAAGSRGGEGDTIVRHPDVRRMLMSMRAQTEAMRALIYFTAGALDRAKRHPDDAERERHQALLDLLIPVAKAWCTNRGCDIASTGIQIHGGAGFIEGTGAAQLFRDARIAPIYEGTNGIQANDLVNRKLMRDKGAAVRAFIAGVAETEMELGGVAGEDFLAIRQRLTAARAALAGAGDWLLDAYTRNIDEALAGATPYLELFGLVAGGWLMAESALAARTRLAEGADPPFHQAKLITTRFFADNLLPHAPAYAAMVTNGARSTLALPEAQF
jgi:acyl-CoA dehydrogenase